MLICSTINPHFFRLWSIIKLQFSCSISSVIDQKTIVGAVKKERKKKNLKSCCSQTFYSHLILPYSKSKDLNKRHRKVRKQEIMKLRRRKLFSQLRRCAFAQYLNVKMTNEIYTCHLFSAQRSPVKFFSVLMLHN